MRGVAYGHRGNDCTFETLLRTHDLDDPALWRMLSMVCDDEQVLEVTGAMFDGLHAFFRRELVLGREPS
jgi:hypothetical protein